MRSAKSFFTKVGTSGLEGNKSKEEKKEEERYYSTSSIGDDDDDDNTDETLLDIQLIKNVRKNPLAEQTIDFHRSFSNGSIVFSPNVDEPETNTTHVGKSTKQEKLSDKTPDNSEVSVISTVLVGDIITHDTGHQMTDSANSVQHTMFQFRNRNRIQDSSTVVTAPVQCLERINEKGSVSLFKRLFSCLNSRHHQCKQVVMWTLVAVLVTFAVLFGMQLNARDTAEGVGTVVRNSEGEPTGIVMPAKEDKRYLSTSFAQTQVGHIVVNKSLGGVVSERYHVYINSEKQWLKWDSWVWSDTLFKWVNDDVFFYFGKDDRLYWVDDVEWNEDPSVVSPTADVNGWGSPRDTRRALMCKQIVDTTQNLTLKLADFIKDEKVKHWLLEDDYRFIQDIEWVKVPSWWLDRQQVAEFYQCNSRSIENTSETIQIRNDDTVPAPFHYINDFNFANQTFAKFVGLIQGLSLWQPGWNTSLIWNLFTRTSFDYLSYPYFYTSEGDVDRRPLRPIVNPLPTDAASVLTRLLKARTWLPACSNWHVSLRQPCEAFNKCLRTNESILIQDTGEQRTCMPTSCKCLHQLYYEVSNQQQMYTNCGVCASMERTPEACRCWAQGLLLIKIIEGHSCVIEGSAVLEFKRLPWIKTEKCNGWWGQTCVEFISTTPVDLRVSAFFCYDRFVNLLQYL
jgi:hypothetical protein